MRTRETLSALAIIGLLAMAGAAPTFSAEEWDQERVAALAADFSASVNSLFQAARLETREPMSRKNAIYLTVQDLRTLRRFSTRLANQLRAGEGQEETAPLFQRIGRVVRDIRARRGMAPILRDAEEEIEATRAKLEELAAFYGVPAP